MAIVTAAIGAASLATSLYSAYQNKLEQERQEEIQRELIEKQEERENYFKNKFLNKYNEEEMRRDVVMDGDFSKAGGIYNSINQRAENEGDIAEQNVVDNATKRGLEGTGLIADAMTGIDQNKTNSVVGAMGQYAGGLQSNLGMLQGAAFENRANPTAMGISQDKYNQSNPELGNIFNTANSLVDNYQAGVEQKAKTKRNAGILKQFSNSDPGQIANLMNAMND